ncbi:MAG: hypothetical protein PHQ36_12340 [Anaerolineales bacterium]|nr:hypothetical protein [Anaerolineales bacterium]
MSATIKKYLLGAVGIALLAGAIFLTSGKKTPVEIPATPAVVVLSPTPTLTPARLPKNIPIGDDPLKANVIAAGEYLARQQLPNGELSYQVNFLSGERTYSPVSVRLMGGTGALYAVCRVSGDDKYCGAGDLALKHYLRALVADPQKFKGTCLYAEGSCQLGGAALTVDTIYKRWQADGGFFLEDQNLLDTAVELGYVIVSMRKAGGGFYYTFNPHVGGAVDPDYFAAYAQGESLLALVELYEMTGNDFWLRQAREVNAYMIKQRATEDQWHSYALSKLAQADSLSKADLAYAKQIAETIVAGEVRSLNPKNTSVSTATKIEALSALAQVFYLSKEKHKWLDAENRAFILFVQARQLPNNNCGWDISAQVTQNFGGGVFSACDDSSIRVDGLQNWINGVTAYLEYQSMIK